jgi:hypothetical protein
MVSFFHRIKTLFARDKKREIPLILTKADYLAMHVIELPGLEPTRSKKTLRRYEYEYHNAANPPELVPIFPGVSILAIALRSNLTIALSLSSCFKVYRLNNVLIRSEDF